MALVARLALGAVFVVAAISKLSTRGWGRATARALGLPVLLTQTTPGAELLIGAGLIGGLRLMPEAALGLLLVYTGILLVQIARDDAPPCACFGRSAKPITWTTVARNGFLVGLAIISVAT